MKKILWTGLLTGIAMLFVNIAINPLFNIIFPSLKDAYMNEFFRPWDDPIMMLFFAYPILLGFPLAFIWEKTKKQFGNCKTQNALIFTLIFITTISLPTFFINYSSFNLPFTMILSWTLMSVINGLSAGLVLTSLNKN
jgi:hypothetical protein